MIETIFAAKAVAAMQQRGGAGLILGIAAAGIAWRAGSLNRSGFVAAAACGTLCVMAGWSWAAVLILYFMAASVLSRAGDEAKDARTRGVVAKGGARDAVQVLANGGVYSLAAFLAVSSVSPALTWGAVGALAAASADTWATEIGVGLGGLPRSILTRSYVRPGESGGVTGAGIVGSAAGAAWIGLTAMLAGFSRGAAVAALVAGMGGSLTDSLLGATVQERRRCDVCNEPTERLIHLCGSTTRRAGGITGLNNDVVNLLSTFAGLLLGVTVYFIAYNWGVLGR
ncbi:MAG TPA: DUF92 domain-containing protein [Gemmatimonadaceae bacterium]